MTLFDRELAKGLKGIAVVLMVFHHCFRKVSLYEGYALSFFPLQERVVVNLSAMSKLCVSVFAFISGYGLFLSYQKAQGGRGTSLQGEASPKPSASRWVLLRYLKTFSGYWFVYILVFLFYLLTGKRLASVYFSDGFWAGCANAFVDFLGLSKLFGTPSLKGTWWYMSAAFLFILAMPLIYQAVCTKPWVLLLTSLALPLVVFAPLKDASYTRDNSALCFFPVFLLGAIFARTNWFARGPVFSRGKREGEKEAKEAKEEEGEKEAKEANGKEGEKEAKEAKRREQGERLLGKGGRFILEAALLCLCYPLYLQLPLESFWGFHYCLFPVLFLLFCLEYCLSLPPLRRVFTFLGEHSMNIFLLHNFFRTGRTGKLLYSSGHFLIVVTGLLLVSLGASIAVEFLKKRIRYPQAIAWLTRRVMDE